MLVNKNASQEYLIIKQRAQCKEDCITEAFITYLIDEHKPPEHRLTKMTLHYFESFFDLQGMLVNSTYNIFDMTDDFLSMVKTCTEIIPNEKVKLV